MPPSFQSSIKENLHAMERKDNHRIYKKPESTQQEILMSWTIKAKPRDTIHMDVGMAIITLIGIIATSNGIYENYILKLPEDDQSVFLNLQPGIIWILGAIYLWKLVVHQKKTYTYTITEESGTEESSLAFPKIAGTVLKFISISFFILCIATIIYDPALILMLAGPTGMAVLAGRFFLNWNNTPEIEISSEWEKYKFVTIDRKRKLIVAQELDNMIGFEARLPDHLFDEYLSTLKRLLPSDAVFTEESWKW